MTKKQIDEHHLHVKDIQNKLEASENAVVIARQDLTDLQRDFDNLKV